MAVVSNLEFGATVDAWVKKTDERMQAVFRESTQRVVSEAQGNIPVDTGFARASIRGSLSSMLSLSSEHGEPDHSYPYNAGEISMVIARAKLADTIYIGWTANYAIFLEYGHSKQAPSGFVRIAAMQWQQIVSDITSELKSRVG